jgi:DNA helicase-2/ATP-dependent DNA helicase PcrA
LHELLATYRQRVENEPLVDVVADLIQQIRYQDEIHRLYKEPNDQIARWNAVEEVVNALGSYSKRAKKPTLSGFLDEIALGGREDEKDKESQLARNAIALMTLHSAKGLEFPHVYLVGMEEGLLPHHRSISAEGLAIDEERRLCYVGVTRARDRLTLSLALSRNKWGKSRPTIASRFLFELLGKADNPQALAARSQSEKLALFESAGKSAAKVAPKRRPAKKATRPGAKSTRPPKRG